MKNFQVITEIGKINVHSSDSALKFTSKVKDLIQKYEAATDEAAKYSKDIHKKSLDLSNCINNLSKSFGHLGKLNRKVGIPS